MTVKYLCIKLIIFEHNLFALEFDKKAFKIQSVYSLAVPPYRTVDKMSLSWDWSFKDFIKVLFYAIFSSILIGS